MASASSRVAPPVVTYRFGLEPIRPTRRLLERFAPVVDVVNTAIGGFRVELESALTYAEYLRKVRASEFDFGLFEPHLVLEAERRGYQVFARTGRQDRISGVVIARRDAGIRRVRDLKGKAVCFGSPDALASTMLVRLWLRQAGLRDRDIDMVFTGSQESALLEVLSGAAVAGAASKAGWMEFQFTHPEEAGELELKWRTEELTGPAFMAHVRVPAEHRRLVAQALTRLNDSERGRAALVATLFSEIRPAVSGSYDDVWEFMMAYRRSFGPRPWAAVYW